MKLEEWLKEVLEMAMERNHCATVPPQFSGEFQTGHLATVGDLTKKMLTPSPLAAACPIQASATRKCTTTVGVEG